MSNEPNLLQSFGSVPVVNSVVSSFNGKWDRKINGSHYYTAFYINGTVEGEVILFHPYAQAYDKNN